MRLKVYQSGLMIALFATGLAAGYLTKMLSSTELLSRPFARSLALNGISSVNEEATLRELHRKFSLYDLQSREFSLWKGMVVIKDVDGRPIHTCDSLLFSALRYVALKKAGDRLAANEAWEAITGSYIDGKWRRHPQCRDKATSRDMILGLLIALSAKPPQGKEILENLIEKVGTGGGFFDDGPFYVSFMTPQIADLIRALAIAYEIPMRRLPALIRYSFSTLDINAMELKRGYQSHLLALGLWLEMEILQSELIADGKLQDAPRSALSWIVAEDMDMSVGNLFHWHWDFVAEKLVAVDDHNLFFRYLHLKANKRLDRTELLLIAHELTQMPQFPNGFLPMDCDRKADYLWQRDSREMKLRKAACRLVYPGVDYLWLAGNVLADLRALADNQTIDSMH